MSSWELSRLLSGWERSRLLSGWERSWLVSSCGDGVGFVVGMESVWWWLGMESASQVWRRFSSPWDLAASSHISVHTVSLLRPLILRARTAATWLGRRQTLSQAK